MSYSITNYHGNYNITRRSSTIKYIVVHYTAGTGSAKNNCIYFGRANRNASAHYFIDDNSIYEYADPKAYATWHCGDGRGKYGITNQNSIGIEVVNTGGPFSQAEIDRLAWLVQKLMKQFNISASNVVRHYDASRKQCPAYYVKNSGEWAKLKNQITGAAASIKPTANSNSSIGYKVKVTVDALNIRAGAGTSYKINGVIRDKGVYTIVQTKGDWGKLKSGIGWIHLGYTKKI